MFGRLERVQALAHTANFDIALYPREKDEGIQAAKIAEYMGLGVPTVSYDYAVTEELRETGAGVLVADARAFVDAVVHLAQDSAARGSVAAAAAAAGLARSWDVLAARYRVRDPRPLLALRRDEARRAQPRVELPRVCRIGSLGTRPHAGHHRRDREGGVRGLDLHRLADDDASAARLRDHPDRGSIHGIPPRPRGSRRDRCACVDQPRVYFLLSGALSLVVGLVLAWFLPEHDRRSAPNCSSLPR